LRGNVSYQRREMGDSRSNETGWVRKRKAVAELISGVRWDQGNGESAKREANEKNFLKDGWIEPGRGKGSSSRKLGE